MLPRFHLVIAAIAAVFIAAAALSLLSASRSVSLFAVGPRAALDDLIVSQLKLEAQAPQALPDAVNDSTGSIARRQDRGAASDTAPTAPVAIEEE